MKLLIAILLLVGTSSFMNWYSNAPVRSWLRKPDVRLEEGVSDDSNLESTGTSKFPLIDNRIMDIEIDENLIDAMEIFLVSAAAYAGLPSDIFRLGETDNTVIRSTLKVPKDTRVTVGMVRDFLSGLVNNEMKKLTDKVTVDSRGERNEEEDLGDGIRMSLSQMQQELFPDPSYRLKLTGPRDLLLSTLGAKDDSPVTISEDTLGKFFFDLLLDQSIFDASLLLSGGGDNIVNQYNADPEEFLDPLELKLAELAMEHYHESFLTQDGLNLDGEKRSLAKYMKARVMPVWFSDHREELSDMVGISLYHGGES